MRTAVANYVNPELENLRRIIGGARTRLAELQSAYTKARSQIDAVQSALFRRLQMHYQRRDRLRLVVDYRKKYLEALLRDNDEEARQCADSYEQAKADTNKDYEETAKSAANKRHLTADEEGEVSGLWKKLVKLYHPDRFSHQPQKLETYHRLASTLNRARDDGDIDTLRKIAHDPHGFILCQGWTDLDFSEDRELAQLQRLHDLLEQEIATIGESLHQLRQSPDFELAQIVDKKPTVLGDVAVEQAQMLDKESDELEAHASRLASAIAALTVTENFGIA
jgi:DNA polymerase-3 subunit epsilon